MLFDTHAHYDDEQFDNDRQTLLASLPEHGVGLVVNPGITVETSRQAVDFARCHPHMYAAVGIHPENCHDFCPEQIQQLRQLAAEPKVVAIGEIGLDYYWAENPPKEVQQEAFRCQLALAEELHLPVIVHDREAHADTLSMVQEFPKVTGVFHCFSGSVEMARQLVDMGWMLSFNGAITFKNARKAPEVVRAIPLDRLMIETDAPYLTPVPYRGKRNDSTYVHLVAETIAAIRELPVEEVVRITTENGKRFFGIA
ncbi:MAG: TatD family deoxyribonuclease [Ruminococcaceae bacterium]|nr:TatD family deoxyribonuclease [Oscillospiraceae bacterium]